MCAVLNHGRRYPQIALPIAIHVWRPSCLSPSRLATGQLTVPVGEARPLAEVNEAFERIGQRPVRGKIVLDATA
jgi:hypothetical protein